MKYIKIMAMRKQNNFRFFFRFILYQFNVLFLTALVANISLAILAIFLFKEKKLFWRFYMLKRDMFLWLQQRKNWTWILKTVKSAYLFVYIITVTLTNSKAVWVNFHAKKTENIIHFISNFKANKQQTF